MHQRVALCRPPACCPHRLAPSPRFPGSLLQHTCTGTYTITVHQPQPAFVRMSTWEVLAARWCTLITRCTMGISRPSVLNTTAG